MLRDLNLGNPDSLSVLFSFDLRCQNKTLFKYFVEFYFYFMSVTVLPKCMLTTCVQYPWRPDESMGFPGIGVTEASELPCEC